MATSSVSPPIFTGQSSFATSLQAVLSRAVQTASLPMQLVQANVNTLQSQQSALNNLENTFNTLQNSLQTLGSATAGSVLANSSSSAITASASSTAPSGTYSVQVDRVGSGATALSNLGATVVSDPATQNISPASSFTLSLDGNTVATITPTGTSLQSLAQAINDSGTDIQATIVNVGGSSGDDYRLALSSSNFSVQNIQLNDGSSDLINTISGGVTAQYEVNGSAQINSNSNQVNIAPGLTANLVATTTSAATITVAQDFTAVSSTLSAFAAAYNAAVDALGQQTGTSAGPLSGNSIVSLLSSVLRNMSQTTGGSGTVTSFASLGLDLDKTGHLSFDSAQFASVKTADVQTFLGGINTGGFLQSANDALNSVTDSSNGSIHLNFASIQTQVDLDNQQIADQQNRLTTMQNSLMAQLSAADAAIASLESQKSYFLQLFQAQYPSSSAGG